LRAAAREFRGRLLTALEHQPIPVTLDGSGWSLTPTEAERLAQIGEQRPGFCEVGHRKVKLAQFCGVAGLGDRMLEILPKTQHEDRARTHCRHAPAGEACESARLGGLHV
jgi:5-methylcytosine-specific restriction enzyme subunit McrC